ASDILLRDMDLGVNMLTNLIPCILIPPATLNLMYPMKQQSALANTIMKDWKAMEKQSRNTQNEWKNTRMMMLKLLNQAKLMNILKV
ncbi:hypothetical protein HDV04_001833, partial [Boothiomyces sp. JEL0838]